MPNRVFQITKYIFTFILFLSAYYFGAYSYHRNYWPVQLVKSLYQMLPPPKEELPPVQTKQSKSLQPSFSIDQFDRLASYPGKIQVACPKQTSQTKVLLLIGQSNAGNHAGQRHRSSHGANIINFFQSKCYIAESPLLGSSGTAGEAWTLLANKLIDNNLADRVILVPAAISSSPIHRWQAGGDLNNMLLDVIHQTNSQYTITDILWHQGEVDFRMGTDTPSYVEMFKSLLESLRRANVNAATYVSVASKCWLLENHPWQANNSVAHAQILLPNMDTLIFSGVNSDALMQANDRYDDCHFSGTGQEKFANEWVSILSNNH